MSFYAIILAAGKGERMRGEAASAEFPKVLRQLCGRPMIAYVIDAIRAAGVSDITIIVGFGADHVRRTTGGRLRYILQKEQLGSGHAVASGKGALGGRGGNALIMCGDSPLFTAATISSLMEHHTETRTTITLVSAVVDDPPGYGRVTRGPSGRITGIVEEKCATPEERAIREINGGAYAFDSKWLWANIDRIEPGEGGELYLTDLVRIATSEGREVDAVPAAAEEVLGVNTPADLRRVEDILRRRAEGGASKV
jgi:bifunctional UDP-N-acetylglucosamine pyrophosphorylase/glucosamine-1-phosphate N-acetyltransferase